MLPEEWKEALERDRAGFNEAADPGPERRAARLLAAFIATGVVFMALPGTLLGVWNLIAIAQQHAPGGASTAWIQAHGQAQLLGWVGTFIIGISLYFLPKVNPQITQTTQKNRITRWGWVVWAMWTAGLAWRWAVGVGYGGFHIGLVGSSLLELAAFVLANYLLWRPTGSKSAMPKDLGSWMGIAGFSAFLLALLLNAGISVWVATHSALPVYPAAVNRIFLTVTLWGFAVPLAWGYSTRFVTVFAGLEQPNHRLSRWLAILVGALTISALAGWFFAADALALAATIVAIRALRMFRPAVRKPKLLGVYRGYPAFARAAYGWLIVGAALGVAAGLWPSQSGMVGASRHAVTVGFLATLIFAIGPRILPSFLNSRELYSTRLMAASLWMLNAGCFLRVSSEAVAYSTGGLAWRLLPVSALLELTAVLLFAINIGMTLTQPVPAWFGPEGVNTRMPLYWYVTSYPKTRSLLMQAGLKTLARTRTVPRSLTLAEAASADDADVEHLLDVLRGFFSARQPRRRSA